MWLLPKSALLGRLGTTTARAGDIVFYPPRSRSNLMCLVQACSNMEDPIVIAHWLDRATQAISKPRLLNPGTEGDHGD